MVVEVIGGIISGSLALLADATHMLTDALALGLAASAHHFARRPADLRNHFGYSRAQVLAAFVNGIALFVLIAWIVVEAIHRFAQPVEVAARPMLAVAVVGLIANAVAFFVLHRGESTNVNVRGAMLHVISDMLGSIAAIVAGVVILTTNWTPIDPLLSLVVAALIGRSAWVLVKETGHILLEGAPRHIDIKALAEGVQAAAPAVRDVHDVRIWQLTPGQASLTLHARVEAARDAEKALEGIKAYPLEAHGISQSTVQIEVGDSSRHCVGAALIGSVTPITAAKKQRQHQHAHHHHHARTECDGDDETIPTAPILATQK